MPTRLCKVLVITSDMLHVAGFQYFACQHTGLPLSPGHHIIPIQSLNISELLVNFLYNLGVWHASQQMPHKHEQDWVSHPTNSFCNQIHKPGQCGLWPLHLLEWCCSARCFCKHCFCQEQGVPILAHPRQGCSCLGTSAKNIRITIWWLLGCSNHALCSEVEELYSQVCKAGDSGVLLLNRPRQQAQLCMGIPDKECCLNKVFQLSLPFTQ